MRHEELGTNSGNQSGLAPGEAAPILNALTEKLRADRLAYEAGVAEQKAFTDRVHHIEGLVTGITQGNHEAAPGTSQLFDLLNREATKDLVSFMTTEEKADGALSPTALAREINDPRQVLLEAAYTQEDPAAFLEGIDALIGQDSRTEEWQQAMQGVDSVIASVLHDRTVQTDRYQTSGINVAGQGVMTSVRIAPAEGMATAHAQVMLDGVSPFDLDAAA